MDDTAEVNGPVLDTATSCSGVEGTKKFEESKTTTADLPATSNLEDYAQMKWLKNQEFTSRVENEVKADPIMIKLKEMVQIFQETNSNGDLCNLKSDKPQDFDWDSVYQVSSKILEDYSKEVELEFNKLDKINKELGLWQEAGFTFDAHRGIKVMNDSEQWMKQKETYVKYRQEQLDTTVKEISNTVKKLTKQDDL